jgi:protein subunit release factor B
VPGSPTFRSVFDFATKQQQVARLEEKSAAPNFWDDAESAQALFKQLSGLRDEISPWIDLARRVDEAGVLLDLAEEADDADTRAEVERELTAILSTLEDLEFKLVLSGPYDKRNALLAVHAGTGGTEAQDWAAMLLRMYIRWAERHKYKVDINPAELRIDTYRASGAGGQHVNKTDSAVRITHLPTNIVVQCQTDRSQHRNRAEAFAMLKSKLYELELRKRQEEQAKLEDSKTDIGWGHQIRSYVLDQSRIKDLRTNHEVGNTQAVLDGDLDDFISASLKQGV